MLRTLVLAMGLTFLVSGPTIAAKMTEKQICLSGVAIVLETLESEDTPKPGDWAMEQVNQLVEISTHLCEQGNFKYANDLLAFARGLIASE